MAQNQSFETSLTALEKIVRDLETGDLPLEESLKMFEEGVRLSRECQERLNQAERRIEILLRDTDGNPILKEFEGETLAKSETAAPKTKRRYVFDGDDDEEEESVF